jgi:GTP 3',8-cyclase
MADEPATSAAVDRASEAAPRSLILHDRRLLWPLAPEFLYEAGARSATRATQGWTMALAAGTSAFELDRAKPGALIDPFNRAITYLRVSVTDRCDFRCVYCMSEHMTFLPKADLLSLEELDRLCSAFVAKGVTKLRLTGGEPLVRRGIMTLVSSLSRHLASGALHELTLTTNGSQLQKYAPELKASGIERINVSLDTLDADKFRAITRWGDLGNVMAGIDAAQGVGLKVKINTVALKGVNEAEIAGLLEWAHGRGMDLTVIEVMPLGDVDASRLDQYLPLSMVRAGLAEKYTLDDIDYSTGGPARYVRVKETGGRLGFITPLTHNFCESCNRVRITCTGTLYMCLGQNDAADLRSPLRASESDSLVHSAIDEAITRKPKGHDFVIDRRHKNPALPRHMSTTGG